MSNTISLLQTQIYFKKNTLSTRNTVFLLVKKIYCFSFEWRKNFIANVFISFYLKTQDIIRDKQNINILENAVSTHKDESTLSMQDFLLSKFTELPFQI